MNFVINQALKNKLKPELAQLNQRLETLAAETGDYLGELMKYVLIGSGKRLRPALVYLCSELGKSSRSAVETVEMAVELIHIATLIHDDVIDNAALRRGQKTVFHEHGVDAAVLLGDHIYTKAFQMVAELKEPLLLQLMAESTSLMCQGEIDQLKKRYQFTLSEQEYFSFIEKKTASLFGVSARSGAILAQQGLPIQKAVEKVGLYLGIAFQITDDLLDLTGDELVVGKTLRTDLMNGKMTLPLIHYRDQLKNPERIVEFGQHLKSPNGHLSMLVNDMKESGSLAYANAKVEWFINQALAELSILPNGSVKENLSLIAELLRQREA